VNCYYFQLLQQLGSRSFRTEVCPFYLNLKTTELRMQMKFFQLQYACYMHLLTTSESNYSIEIVV
jgi:hypothetical protein